MTGNYQIICTALAVVFSIVIPAVCGDPGELPAAQSNEGTLLIETLELSFRDQSLVTFDPAVDNYSVDVNMLVDEVTLRAVPRDPETELVMTQDGLVVPLEDGEAVIRLGSSATRWGHSCNWRAGRG